MGTNHLSIGTAIEKQAWLQFQLSGDEVAEMPAGASCDLIVSNGKLIRVQCKKVRWTRHGWVSWFSNKDIDCSDLVWFSAGEKVWLVKTSAVARHIETVGLKWQTNKNNKNRHRGTDGALVQLNNNFFSYVPESCMLTKDTDPPLIAPINFKHLGVLAHNPYAGSLFEDEAT